MAALTATWGTVTAGHADGAESGDQLLLGVTDCVLAIWSRQPRRVFSRLVVPAPLLLHLLATGAAKGMLRKTAVTVFCAYVFIVDVRRQPRMALPLLRTADLLITQCFADSPELPAGGVLPEGSPAPIDTAEHRLLALVQAVRKEARGCADTARPTAAATVLCHAAARGAAVRAAALPPVLALLSSRYPKARSALCSWCCIPDASHGAPANHTKRGLPVRSFTSWAIRQAGSPMSYSAVEANVCGSPIVSWAGGIFNMRVRRAGPEAYCGAAVCPAAGRG